MQKIADALKASSYKSFKNIQDTPKPASQKRESSYTFVDIKSQQKMIYLYQSCIS